MNRDELKKILPHREPMLLVDEAHMTEDGRAVGTYTVRGDEFFLQGHFPGNPVVPGVILCEIMAQCCCVLLQDAMKSGETERITPYYTSLNNVKFRSPAKPGDVLEITCEIDKVKEPFYFAKGQIAAGGKKCVSADFSFALIRG